jgi:hypothetical protein
MRRERMSEPIDGVGEVLRIGDRVAFQPPQRMVVGRVIEVHQPPKLTPIGQQQQPYGRVKIVVEIDHLYGLQQGHPIPMDSVFKMAEPLPKMGLN